MVEHLNKKQIEEYRQQQLEPAELLFVSEHLDECEACRSKVLSELNNDESFFAIHSAIGDESDGLHLTEDQISDYLDKNLSGDTLQLASDHLISCVRCQVAIEDLRTFKNSIAPSLDREFSPAAPTQVSEGWWQRFVGSLPPVLRVSPAPAFATALVILLLGITGWTFWKALRPKTEIAVLPGPAPQVPIKVESPVPTPTPSQQTPVALLAQLNDGSGQVTLDQDGKLTGVDQLPANYQNLLRKTLNSGRIEKSPQLNGLSRPPSSLMGSDNKEAAFSVLQPAGNVLLSNRPTFRWTPMHGSASYVVEIYDEQFKPVATSLNITSTSWTSPQALDRGKVYSWQVKAMRDGEEVTSPRPPTPQAKFRILDQGKANELERAKRSFGSSHLTMGLLYADAGLLREAEQEFRLVQKANPDSDLAKSLVRQIQNQRVR